jgi:hypothetical protein
LPRREIIDLVVRRFGYTKDYARIWIDREENAGRLKSRRRTIKKWHVLATDRDIDELYVYDLIAMRPSPAPKGKVADGVRWPEARAIAWAVLGEPLELRNWPSEMDGKIRPTQLELRRQTGASRLRIWGRPAAEETLQQMPADLFRMSDYILVVHPLGNLSTEPPRELRKYQDKFNDRPWDDPRDIERDANEIMRAFPKLLPSPAAEWLTKLDAVIALEANRADWTRLVELIALVGGNPENSMPEENAIVRLVVGFDCLSAWVTAELHGALQEAEELIRRVWDRAGEAGRAGQLEIKGRNVSDLAVLVTIPARLVTADQIWSWLHSSELEIEGQRYVDVQIGPPVSPETTPETQHAEKLEKLVEDKTTPGRKPGIPPKQQAMCKAARNILENDCRRPKPQGRNAAIARMLIKQREFKDYKPTTIEDYIRSEVRGWEKSNPGK